MSEEVGEAVGFMMAAVVVVGIAIAVLMATATIGAAFGAGHAMFNYGEALLANIALEKPER